MLPLNKSDSFPYFFVLVFGSWRRLEEITCTYINLLSIYALAPWDLIVFGFLHGGIFRGEPIRGGLNKDI